MSFDFVAFRRLLFQNALDDATDMLGKYAPAEFRETAGDIRSQLEALRSSSRWNPFRHRKRNKSFEKITRNLYQSGLAASKAEPPPELTAVNPWWRIIAGYSAAVLLIAALGFMFFYQPSCPAFDENTELAIIVDKFGTSGQPFFQKIGLNKETLEKQISDQLSKGGIGVAVHRVKVGNTERAREKCAECGARMMIWGDVEYGDSVRAYLNHYLDHESYDTYIMQHGIPGVEEHYKNVFKLQTSQWIGEIECLIKLFQGLMAKEKYQTGTGEEKAAALAEAEKVFTDLSTCATDVALKIFALHCKGWAEIQNNKPEEALVTYDLILGIDSTNALALNNSALLYEASNSPLHAHTRYEKILAKNDIPYIRLANAEALTKLDRKEEAAKEIRHVREGTDYQIKREVYETRIRKIPTAAVVPSSVTAQDPSSSLSMIAIQVNDGRRSDALRNLEALERRTDAATLSPENLAIMRELYLKVGAEEKANDVNDQAARQGVRLQSNTTTLSRAIRAN